MSTFSRKKSAPQTKPWLCLGSELCFPFKICPVMENMHSTSTDDALLVSTTSTVLYQQTKWNCETMQQHDLFCHLAIKETNFVLNCNSSFIVIFQSRRRHCKYDWLESVWYEYDWRRRLSHVNMTDSDLTKYDWRRRLGGGGYGD